MLDTQKYRCQNRLSKRTVSIWTYINDNAERFANPYFSPADGVLKLKPEFISLRLWREHFLQWTDLSRPADDQDGFVEPDPREELLARLLEENRTLKAKLAAK